MNSAGEAAARIDNRRGKDALKLKELGRGEVCEAKHIAELTDSKGVQEKHRTRGVSFGVADAARDGRELVVEDLKLLGPRGGGGARAEGKEEAQVAARLVSRNQRDTLGGTEGVPQCDRMGGGGSRRARSR